MADNYQIIVGTLPIELPIVGGVAWALNSAYHQASLDGYLVGYPPGGVEEFSIEIENRGQSAFFGRLIAGAVREKNLYSDPCFWETNMLAGPRSDGEPSLVTMADKEIRQRSDAPMYKRILRKWGRDEDNFCDLK